ncbi:MAG: hypothetical protein RTU63_14045 [Candidatus Thorarchaeota archaeon]
MKGFEVGPRQKALILVGLVIASVGFGLHFMVPGAGRSGFVIVIQPMETSVEPISLSLESVEHSFQFYFLGPDHTNLSIYFLDETQYQLYESGTALSNISEQIALDENGRGSYIEIMDSNRDFYLVLVSNHSELLTFTYYYTLLPSTFYPTAMVGFIGLFLIVLGFAWHYTGWKRYFLIGLGVNLVFFLIRIFTLTNYSLGLPEIFLDVIHVEMYNDYQFFYLSWIPNLWEGAWAYSLDLPNYLYPPLWIYTVGLFGASPPWVPGAILFFFNVATGIIVYKIAEHLTEDETTPIVAMLIYLLNPLTVGYGSFMWLNPTPFVFFVMLSFYLALIQKPEWSIIALGVATLYKQFAVIFFPIIALMLIKQLSDRTTKTSVLQFLKHTFIYALIIGVASLPFLIVSPYEYYNQLVYSSSGLFERLTYFIPDLWMTVHFNTFFLWLFGSSAFTDVMALLIYNYVFLAICGLVVYGAFATFRLRQNTESPTEIKDLFMKAIFWSFIAVLCLQTFFPRGAYKFYLLILMPFAVLLFDYKDISLSQKKYTFQKRHLFVPIIVTLIFLCFRFVYLWILVAWAWFYLIQSGELSRIRNGIRSFFSKRRSSPNRESDEIETWEQIYSE